MGGGRKGLLTTADPTIPGLTIPGPAIGGRGIGAIAGPIGTGRVTGIATGR